MGKAGKRKEMVEDRSNERVMCEKAVCVRRCILCYYICIFRKNLVSHRLRILEIIILSFFCHFSAILASYFFVIPKFYLSLFCHFSAIFLSFCYVIVLSFFCHLSCHFSVICLVIFLSFLNPTCHCSVIFCYVLIMFLDFQFFLSFKPLKTIEKSQDTVRSSNHEGNQ